MADRDQISAKYFNQAQITLVPSADVEAFGLTDDLATVARLVGAPDGSKITGSRVSGIDALRLCVANSGVFRYASEYVLYNQGAGLGLRMLVESMYVREGLQNLGIGTRSVMLSLKEAKELGFSSVNLVAAGSATNRSTFFGYHVWPSIGFDAVLPTEKKRQLPDGLAHAEHLSDLMLTEEGVQWWYENGCEIELDFDLDDGSVSWYLYSKYADKKGIRL
jgi:GNAT superfamily N-acetyltransferase